MDEKKKLIKSFFKYIINNKIDKIKLDLIYKILMEIGIYKIIVVAVIII